jgi:hypothetical protein
MPKSKSFWDEQQKENFDRGWTQMNMDFELRRRAAAVHSRNLPESKTRR